jgi:DNA helicase IV
VPSVHPDLEREQAYIVSAYEALAAMQGRTAVVLEAAIDDARRGDTNADAAAMHLGRRLSQLDVGGLALCFGRIDEEAPQSEEPETFYVGRRHVETPRGDPIVVDWRAPVSVPFYRATVQDPFGLKRRRRFSIEGHHLLDILDEVFDDPDSMLSGIAGGIADPLLAELERARTGEMRDIVATIQAEQDVVVRAGLDVCLVVQGGPGTGKTAVGLHRAAYLMYEHREQLTESRVLVIGPNPVFLRYISQVLPSLGETSVVQTTVPGLRGASFPVRAVEPAAVAALKGDVRMASVIERACADRLRRPTEEIVLLTRWGPVRLAPDVMCAALDAARALGRSWQLDRDAFRSSILGLMLEGLERVRPDVLATREQLAEDLRNDRSASSAIDRVWPTISAPAVVRQMLTSRAALSRAAEGILTPDEQARLRRPSAGSAASEPWTAADVPLIDEAEALIAGPPRRYGHIVVDEAQDLSAMALRVLARRAGARPSMTILGDLAQATTAWSQPSWEIALAHLGQPANAQVAELEIGYRVPGPILEMANRLLPEAAPQVRPSRSVRAHGAAPVLVPVEREDLATSVEAELAALTGDWVSVAVIAPEALLAELEAVVKAAAERLGEHGHVALLDPLGAKGLEFDAVVVVEPALIYGEVNGARLLYVAMTRAVQHLSLVHSLALPAVLTAV